MSVSPVVTPPHEQASTMPSVEVARLRLSTILERLPAELKPLVLKIPDDTVTVALPVSTILKQLASGAVKVSLATVHRQAPAGVLGPLPPGDKRLIDVPLSEIFRHVSPQALRRRADQRASDGLSSEFNIFGNAQQPYQIAPTAPDEEPAPVAEAPASIAAPTFTPPAPKVSPALAEEPAPIPPPPRVIAPPPGLFAQRAVTPAPVIPAPAVTPPAAAPVFTLSPQVPTPPPEVAPTLATPPGDTSITIPLGPLSSAWPEPIREELAVLNGSAHIALPKAQVTAGLARGRVTFTWGQIRGWLQPALPQPSAHDDATELTLPLKVVAPIFLVASKKAKAPAVTGFETDIPALFNDRRSPAPAVAEAVAQPEAVAPIPAPVEVAAEPIAPPAPVPEPVVERAPTTVSELFGVPGKTEWTPAELVTGLAKRPGISGAVVALQEGLLVAHSLPEDVKSETIAAFLPQIFARLNQYSGEMKLGEVDDLLFTTHGAHCQIYRLGFVYFAVLGKPGETLPWPELRLVADELSRQTQPKN